MARSTSSITDIYSYDGDGGGTTTLVNGTVIDLALASNADTDLVQTVTTADGSVVCDGAIVTDNTSGNQMFSHIAALPDGGYVVVWSDKDTSVYYTIFNENGVKQQSDIAIDSDGDAKRTTDITVSKDGVISIVWYDFNTAASHETLIQGGPSAANNTVPLLEDQSHTFSATNFGFSDTDGNTLASVTITGLPSSGTLMLDGATVSANDVIDAADIGKLVWTPDADANGAGLDHLSFKVTDSSGNSSSTHTITFDVSPVADDPTAANNTVTLNEDASHTFAASDFGFADVDGDTLASITITGLPNSGTLTLDGTTVSANDVIDAADIGKLVWTPAAGANGKGLDHLSFEVTDSTDSSSSTQTLTFDVNAVNDAPTAVNDTATLVEGKSVTAAVLANDTDIDGNTLHVANVLMASHNGTVTIDDAGKLVVSYTGDDLDAGEKATIKVDYTVSDGDATDTATLTVTVTGVSEGGTDINGTPQKDILTGTKFGEAINGFAADDTIKGLGGNDIIRAGSGNDIANGGAGNDMLGGDEGNDRLNGDGGNDQIYGRKGNDTLNGGAGNDHLNGNQDNDVLVGGEGRDWLAGGVGNDKLTGGAGADTFVFAKRDAHDTITDFTATGKQSDHIDLSDFDLTFKQLTNLMSQDGKDVVIELAGKTEITLQHVDLDTLTKDDFIF